MTHSQFDEFRPPEPPRKRRFGRRVDAIDGADGARKPARRSGGRGVAAAAEGRREMLMVPEVEFEQIDPHSSY